MVRKKCDILIVGAGIAGLSAAKAALENNNLSIDLIEVKVPGANNPSPLTFADVIESHELQDCLKAHYSSFAFQNYNGSMAQFIFNKYPLVVLDYKKACSKILSQIEQRFSGRFTFVDGKATEILQNDQEVVAVLEDGREYGAEVLVDCTGKNKLIASQFENNNITHYSHVYGASFFTKMIIDNDTAFFLLPCKDFGTGGGWFYPLGDGKVSFGYASISTSASVNVNQLKKKFQLALQKFEPYAGLLVHSEINTIEEGTIPITYSKLLTYGRVLIAGDAAGMATSWTCMGVEPALNYGALAGRLAAKAVLEKNINILNQFQVIWEKENKIAYDTSAINAEKFWIDDYYFWEWIIKNDLAYLTPEKLLDRIRNNCFVPTRATILFRAIKFKLRSLLSKEVLKPKNIIVKC